MCLHGTHRLVGETEGSGMAGLHPESAQEHRKGKVCPTQVRKAHWKEKMLPQD